MKHQSIRPTPLPSGRPLRQVAALPVRERSGGDLEVLLVTSRDTGRWVLPKGGRIRGLDEPQSAAREAWEEGGVLGAIESRPIGAYDYAKTLGPKKSRRSRVKVFRMAVSEELDDWPERAERQRAWISPTEAAAAVYEPDLAALLSALGD